MVQIELEEKLINQNVIGLDLWVSINRKSDLCRRECQETQILTPAMLLIRAMTLDDHQISLSHNFFLY